MNRQASPVIRTFVAVEIDPDTAQRISQAIVQLRPHISGIRWVAQSNFHLTLKFLGDISDSRVEPISNALEAALHPFPRFSINAKGLGVFPDLKRPRILWAGLESERLAELASAVETALERLGFEPENRAFKPHLTIGRWRQFNGSPARLGEQLANWKTHAFGNSMIEEVVLFQSILKPEGASYHRLKVVRLSRDP